MIRDPHSTLEVRLTETAGRARAAVHGEIDLGTAPLLQRVLGETLRGAHGGLDVDLDGVDFLDCSGLNVLLRLREEAEETGVPLHVTRMSRAVLRVL
ncbi:STAS domain-containing protein, partial [Streptomyces sp. PLK6-54]|nr:STAS domain-containing protein [Streptomyces acidipaludis]